MSTVGGTVLYPKLSPKKAGYQAIIYFIFVVTTACMITGTILASTNSDIEKDGKKDVIAGLLGASTAVIGIFSIYLFAGFNKENNEGNPFQYFTPECRYSGDASSSTPSPYPPLPKNVTLQTMILAVFFIVFILMLTAIIMINQTINNEDDLRVINGLVGFSMAWMGLFTCVMGFSFYKHDYPLALFTADGCNIIKFA